MYMQDPDCAFKIDAVPVADEIGAANGDVPGVKYNSYKCPVCIRQWVCPNDIAVGICVHLVACCWVGLLLLWQASAVVTISRG